jgi:hypothetical protein
MTSGMFSMKAFDGFMYFQKATSGIIFHRGRQVQGG